MSRNMVRIVWVGMSKIRYIAAHGSFNNKLPSKFIENNIFLNTE